MQRYSLRWLLSDETGGSKSPSVSVVQPPPPTVTQLPTPSPGETSRQLYESQLEYAPKLQDLQLQLMQQYLPKYQQFNEQQYPQIPMLQQQTQQALQSPYSLNPQQQSAQNDIRQRQRDDLRRTTLESANVGGTLYGGRTQQRLDRAQAELSNQYAMQDIGLQQQQRQLTLQEVLALAQLAGFPVQQISPTAVQNTTPSPDALLQAMSASQFVQPAAIGFGPSSRQLNYQLIGSALGSAGQAAGGAAAACHVAEVLYGTTDLRTFLARLYVLTHDSVFLRAYRRWSVAWAIWLRRLPILQPLVKPIWDRMWQAMVR